MSRITVARNIAAPFPVVFKTVADINNFSQAVPHIVKVEFLSDVKSGVGARFRETRIMNGREASTELEVTEYVENSHVRLVADSHGTVWDSIFTVRQVGANTELSLTMDANAYKFLSKLMNPLMKTVIRKALEKDMDSVKAFCEK
jgi:carbon monoxide dehydrogenase subunit G